MDFDKLLDETAEFFCKLMKEQPRGSQAPEQSSRVFAQAIVFAIKRYEEMKE